MSLLAQPVSRGQMAHHAGSAAEITVARHYETLGFRVAEKRWRGEGGEIDLIMETPDQVVFVEVKQSRSFEAAALRISQRQRMRIFAAAAEYLGTLPNGSLTEARFDVALVNGLGEVQILENAFGES
ncbi:YraN family protein [uncultured Roseobacter sp.]|uniref:YraN family protein n=1 Tax=uncultured Roseobacter sp. TaxID=114847 RepID=UPI00262FA40D|nr:YraN family protein [uncultured Roseobacter sp.]